MKIRRRDFLQASTALVAASAGGIPWARAASSLKSSADGVLSAAASAGDVPGVIAMATNREGAIYEGAFGQRLLGGDAMTTDTVVWIASMTKAITGVAAMQLVEQGKLNLDGAGSQWVPELGRARVLTGWDANGQPITRAPKRPITLRHCLTHTAGWAYELWSDDVARYQKAKGIPGIISCTNNALKTPLLFDPGEKWEYGIGIDWAGKMVEAVTGRRLGDYMEENIFTPLGMTDTAFKIRPDMRARLAKVHIRNAEGVLGPMDFEIPQDPEFEMGGGGLYSTAGNYLKFVQMILNRGTGNGQRLLRPETVDLMSRNAMGSNKVTMLKTAIPSLTNDAEFFPGMDKSWGLSFMINNVTAPTGRTPGSLAWAGLANTYFWIDHNKGVAGVYLTQVLPFADHKALPLFYAFESEVYQSIA
jgi:methyl acetate hydrolase